jgi:magnesium transporter
MAYMSSLMGKPVSDIDGERIGKVADLVASTRGDIGHPEVVAVVIKQREDSLAVPIANVAALVAPAIVLNCRLKDITPYQPDARDLFLARDVLDKQIIDTDGARVVRVNDLDIARVDGRFYVANVDISGLGLLRRVGMFSVAQKLSKRPRRDTPPTVISWDDVELLPGDQMMRLKVPSSKLADLYPADLAEIVSDLNRAESSKFLESLDVKTVADTLEEVEPDFQASLVESMSDEKVADVLEEMAPDEAADLLAELPEDRSQELLSLMQKEEAADVRKLLAYPEDSAGGIMNTEFVAVHPELTAEQTIKLLRETAYEAATIYYVYVTDHADRLVGVFSLRDLVVAQPEMSVSAFMHHRVVSVKLMDTQEEVAQAVAKYNLLAVPVVDDQERLHGIVTVDDALDKIIPTAWKKRLPRLYS